MTADPTPIWRYLEQRFVSLGCRALSRKRIYLDTNFWVMLRDHKSGRQVRIDVEDLLCSLREVVLSGAGFCTFSGHTLSELMKHKDASIRRLTAGLMDELSCGICLSNQDRLFNNEIISFIGSLLAPSMSRWSLSHLAWAKPFFLMTDYQPPSFGLSSDADLELQKGFVEHVWSMSMAQLLEKIDSCREAYPQLDWPKSAAASINSEVRKYDHENETLHEFYLSELNGYLEWAEPRFVERYCEFVSRYQVGVMPESHEQLNVCGKVLHLTAMGIARNKQLSNLMPGTHARSMLHAMIRFDRRRKFKANDLMDIEHAEVALPHCAFFFTDKPNAHLIRSAKLDVELRCVVCSSPEEASKSIKNLLT